MDERIAAMHSAAMNIGVDSKGYQILVVMCVACGHNGLSILRESRQGSGSAAASVTVGAAMCAWFGTRGNLPTT